MDGGVQQPQAHDVEDAHEDGRVGVLGGVPRDEQHQRLQEQLLALRLKQHLVGCQLQCCQRRPRQRPVLGLPQLAALPTTTQNRARSTQEQASPGIIAQ